MIGIIMTLLSGTMSIKNQKAQKASIKEELMPITWHPSRCWDWCVPKDEKRGTEKKYF